MFLFRNQNENNLILSIIPDITVIISILIYFLKEVGRGKTSKISLITFIFGVACYLIAFINIQNNDFILILVRQILLPIFFLAVSVGVMKNNEELARDALKFSVLSFFCVSLLAILNTSGFITLNHGFEPLYPYLHFEIEKDLNSNANALSRSDGLLFLPRLNLLSGGSLGSCAAIFFALGISVFNIDSFKSNIIKIIIGLTLIISSILTLSNSIIFPIVIFIALYLKVKIKNIPLGLILTIITFYSLLNLSIFLKYSPLQYFRETILDSILNHASNITIWKVVFGGGPAVYSKGYEYVPSDGIADIGIFMLLDQYGLVIFSGYIILLANFVKYGITENKEFSKNRVIPSVFIFWVFLFLVHGNISLQPPFYGLFAACVAGMIAKKNFKINGKIISN